MKYLIISFDPHEQQPFADQLDAPDANQALEMVADQRPNCLPVIALTRADLQRLDHEMDALDCRLPIADNQQSTINNQQSAIPAG